MATSALDPLPQLGEPLPDSAHAVSVALPRWKDVVGYENEKPDVMKHIKTGYPRFVVHPFVKELAQHLGNGLPCLPFPSVHVAGLCAQFVRHTSGAKVDLAPAQDCCGVITNEVGRAALNDFWQQTGLVVSSRRAQAYLDGTFSEREGEIFHSLRQQLAGLYDCGEDDIFLQPSGMAAQFAALRAIGRRRPGRPTAQLGFPNSDTLKLQQNLGNGSILLHSLESLKAELRRLLHERSLAACFCEVPGNPLLGSADLNTIRPLLREHHVPLVGDDTIGTPLNVDLSNHADLIATSLTKFFAGTGDVMGGALICNPKSPFYSELKPLLKAGHEELLWWEDAAVLDTQARDFPDRMRQHNRNGLLIAERLRHHPAVERVWYPKWEFGEAYEAVRRPEGGWGSLLSFMTKNAETIASGFYDRLLICKGPSFGTVFTLACPFTLLAHSSELDWAESCGVSRYLIRLSVGLENPEAVWDQLDFALGNDQPRNSGGFNPGAEGEQLSYFPGPAKIAAAAVT